MKKLITLIVLSILLAVTTIINDITIKGLCMFLAGFIVSSLFDSQ